MSCRVWAVGNPNHNLSSHVGGWRPGQHSGREFRQRTGLSSAPELRIYALLLPVDKKLKTERIYKHAHKGNISYTGIGRLLSVSNCRNPKAYCLVPCTGFGMRRPGLGATGDPAFHWLWHPASLPKGQGEAEALWIARP